MRHLTQLCLSRALVKPITIKQSDQGPMFVDTHINRDSISWTSDCILPSPCNQSWKVVSLKVRTFNSASLQCHHWPRGIITDFVLKANFLQQWNSASNLLFCFKCFDHLLSITKKYKTSSRHTLSLSLSLTFTMSRTSGQEHVHYHWGRKSIIYIYIYILCGRV